MDRPSVRRASAIPGSVGLRRQPSSRPSPCRLSEPVHAPSVDPAVAAAAAAAPSASSVRPRARHGRRKMTT